MRTSGVHVPHFAVWALSLNYTKPLKVILRVVQTDLNIVRINTQPVQKDPKIVQKHQKIGNFWRKCE